MSRTNHGVAPRRARPHRRESCKQGEVFLARKRSRTRLERVRMLCNFFADKVGLDSEMITAKVRNRLEFVFPQKVDKEKDKQNKKEREAHLKLLPRVLAKVLKRRMSL